MPLTLNTNIDSLNAQRNLTTSKSTLSQALQRLSSGLKINSAADDAAGLAIATDFTTQINGTNQAVNNANDAVSEAQTAGGALSTLTQNLQSIRTLAVEAANGSNSASDRAALDQQVQQQIAEITRIASQTNFNGSRVLDGSAGVTNYQVGANVGSTISVNLTQGVRADQIGQVASASTTVTTAALTGTLSIAVGTGTAVTVGTSVAGTQAGQNAGSAYSKAQAINSSGIAGLTASASTAVTEASGFSNVVAGTAAASYDLSINGQAIYGGTGNVAAGSTLTAANVAAQINLYSSLDGNVTASVASGKLTLTAADGSDIKVQQTVGAASSGTGIDTSVAGTLGTAGGTLATGQVDSGKVTLESNSNIQLSGSDVAFIGQTAGTISLGASTLANANVLTVSGANSTINAVDAALSTVSSLQSQLGAIQNRFTSTVSNLQSTVQNLTQSRSTIQDADFAAETAKLTQSNVLQQAGISVLAQANQQPQLILKLLQ
ncbi:MAG TPA: flagellin [Steroidobacteraceae bacterium]|nr:flagellin [Steroidobacteraceae bacterium]